MATPVGLEYNTSLGTVKLDGSAATGRIDGQLQFLLGVNVSNDRNIATLVSVHDSDLDDAVVCRRKVKIDSDTSLAIDNTTIMSAKYVDDNYLNKTDVPGKLNDSAVGSADQAIYINSNGKPSVSKIKIGGSNQGNMIRVQSDYNSSDNSGGMYVNVPAGTVYTAGSGLNLNGAEFSVDFDSVAQKNHNHTGTYSPVNHNHDGVYLKLSPTPGSGQTEVTQTINPGTNNTAKIDHASNTTLEITASAFFADSDRNLKENITPLVPNDNIFDVPIVEFNWRDTKAKSIGIIAQDLEKVAPIAVSTSDSGMKSVNYTTFLLLRIASLEKRLSELESKMK